MTRIADHRSILGVDPTSRGLAFAAFENGELIDWGTRRSDGNELLVLDQLLENFRADVLVLEDGFACRSERRPRMRHLLRHLAEHARSRDIDVIVVSRYEARTGWARKGATRKHAMAAAIGEMFPEIAPYVPRKRKVYRSEEARTELFDAMSLVMHACGTAA